MAVTANQSAIPPTKAASLQKRSPSAKTLSGYSIFKHKKKNTAEEEAEIIKQEILLEEKKDMILPKNLLILILY